jgi:hypothetical protein
MWFFRSEWLGLFQDSIFPLSAISFALPIAIGTPQKDIASIGARKQAIKDYCSKEILVQKEMQH